MMTAMGKGYAICRVCNTITDRPGEACVVCGNKTRMRDNSSLQKVWALWFAGVIAYIPANLLPLMVTESVSGDSASTIVGGIITLLHHGSYLVALVIFIASIGVPIAKFAIIAWLALSVQWGWAISEHHRLHAYELVEIVGRWSMVDVFVVAALAALIDLDGLMSIKPGIGVDAFALSVIFTMFAANAFDSRLFWDRRHRASTLAQESFNVPD